MMVLLHPIQLKCIGQGHRSKFMATARMHVTAGSCTTAGGLWLYLPPDYLRDQ